MLEQALTLRPDLEVLNIPEGHTVGQIHVVPLDVFGPEVPFMRWAILFHATTRESLLRAQLILSPGEPFDRTRAREAARVLLNPVVISAAVVVPIRSQTSGEVDLLIITKDIWSLRLNTGFQLTGATLDFLSMSIGETNFLGYHKNIALAFLLEQDAYSFGPFYEDRFLFNSRHKLSSQVLFSLNRDTHDFEGVFGFVQVGRPLFSQYTKWAWDLTVLFRDVIERRFSQGEQLRYPLEPAEGEETMLWAWRNRQVDAAALGTYALGTSARHEFSAGWGVFYRGPDADVAEVVSPELLSAFEENVLPRRELWSFPIAQYRVWTPRYQTYFDLDALGLGEDVALGPDLTLRLTGAHRYTGSQRAFIGLSGRLGFRFKIFGDDLLEAATRTSARYETIGWRGLKTEANLRYVTPPLLFARFVFASFMQLRRRDPDNILLSLGGHNALRGYPSELFLGSSLIRFNVEMRTLPLYLWSVPVGMILFWDGGDAFYDFDDPDVRKQFTLKQSVGLGLRWMFPQFNRFVYRLDWGFPLNSAQPFPGLVHFGFEQAF